MNFSWQTTYITNAQTLCLRGDVRVSAQNILGSTMIEKDFVDHDPGGSDG